MNKKVGVVQGGWKMMTKVGFPFIWEGKIHFPKKIQF